jgi:hypothetical protein
MVLDIIGKANELHALVGGGFYEPILISIPAADHFDLAVSYQRFQALEIFGAVLFDPGEQRAGIMEADVDTGVLRKSLDKGQVAAHIGLLENMAEVAARLMGVYEQNQMELRRHGDGAFSRETE